MRNSSDLTVFVEVVRDTSKGVKANHASKKWDLPFKFEGEYDFVTSNAIHKQRLQ